MSNRWLLFVLILTGFEQGCSQNTPASAQISGILTPHAEWRPKVYLVRPGYYRQLLSSFEGAVIDSADISADGRFELNPALQPGAGIYLLFVQKKDGRYPNEILPGPEANYICLSLRPGARVGLSGEVASLTQSYRLEAGDADSRLLAQLRDLQSPLLKEQEQPGKPEDPAEEWAPHAPGATEQAYKNGLEKFLDTTRAVLPAFVALRLRAPENEFRDKPEFFLRILERLRQQAPDDPWPAQLATFLDPSRLPVLAGEKMPDFALPTPAGDTLHSARVKAPLLLVDFWASWCAPCRAENRTTIRPLYESFHQRGFEVIGVSIDRSREAWVAAIRKDGAVWPQVSDLLGDASPVRQSLKFDFIPNNYLLDAEGRLLARNLHKDELKAFVERFFTQN